MFRAPCFVPPAPHSTKLVGLLPLGVSFGRAAMPCCESQKEEDGKALILSQKGIKSRHPRSWKISGRIAGNASSFPPTICAPKTNANAVRPHRTCLAITHPSNQSRPTTKLTTNWKTQKQTQQVDDAVSPCSLEQGRDATPKTKPTKLLEHNFGRKQMPLAGRFRRSDFDESGISSMLCRSDRTPSLE
ncbi:hypothetical protein B0T16DRAFT_37254 [Cercophora newfieldiana]|uniref:Uncharacterized protein n=1 Tax=Cercophora newfieldiana TaxID=92897 RepID=A0AA39YPQ9_9PEZI|nr:hypothetical protein B0T16DRAFT_37254 [Cercophora newfieldiana]